MLRSWNIFEKNISALRTTVDAAEKILYSNNFSDNLSVCNIMCQSARVMLCGYFEGYIRELAKEYIQELNRSQVRLEELNHGIINNILKEKSRIYDSLVDGNFDDVISCIKSSSHININIDKHIKTESNPSVDNIERIFENLGFNRIVEEACIHDYGMTTYICESNFDLNMEKSVERNLSVLTTDISKLKQELKILIDKKWTPKTKRRPVAYVNVIQELLKSRNGIAHGDESIDSPTTPKDLRDNIRDIERLSIFFKTKIEDRLIEYRTSVPV
jgi:hypothetical protein